MNKTLPLLFAALLSFAPNTWAEWRLDSEASSVGFLSVKNGQVVESHHFNKLEGSVSASGNATLIIKLDSVDTMIPIRNERMREMLFKTASFPDATVSVSIDMAKFGRLKAGEALSETVAGKLEMVGQSATVMVPVSVIRGHNSVIVSSRKPVVINAANWGLTDGLEALRNIANLSSITPAVPVSFTLKFDRAEK